MLFSGLQQQVRMSQRGSRPQYEGKNMRFSDNRHHQDRQARRYNDPNRMNEETFGSTAVREQREQFNKGEDHLTVFL